MIPKQHIETSIVNPISEGDDMSNIESFTSLVQQLTASVKLWNDLRYICVGATAIFTVLSFFTFWVAGTKTDLLGKAKDDLTKIKDREQTLQIATLNTETTKAKEGIEVAKAQAAQANEKAEGERLARVKLEARLADRKLTNEQQDRLVLLLEPFRDAEVDVVVLGDTSEIRLIGMTLLECLHKAGWKVYQGYGSGGGVVVKGILVGVRSDSNLLNAANALVSGLKSMGIDAGSWDFEKLQYPMILMNTNLTHKAPIKIFIGSKP